MEDFIRFLKKVRKRNGDKLLPITIEKYAYFIEEYIAQFETYEADESLVQYMNKIIRQRPSIVIYSAFRMYLLYRGLSKKDSLLSKLEPPEKNANAFSSKQFLQSKVLSKGELNRLFNEADKMEKLIISALYDTACRRRELLNITFEDIEFLKNKKANDSNIYAEVNILGKGAKRRVVYFGKTTVDLINELYPNKLPKQKVFVIRLPDGTSYKSQPQALYNLVMDLTKRSIGRAMSTHSFRHSKLTHLADDGADVLGIANYAGHENISTTMIYIEISNRMGKITFENYAKDISNISGGAV